MKIRKKIILYGIVQGVGFHPFIHRLVKKYNLSGWICNSNQGAEIEVEGEESDYQKFLAELKNHPPTPASINQIKIKNLPVVGYSKFYIKESNSKYRHPMILMPPDISSCEDCVQEYRDIKNRHYHVQPDICPVCGPQVALYVGNEQINIPDPIREAKMRLRKGEIGVIKGLGGFHLACDAQNERAVSKIREIKKRDQKPFALMAESISHIKNFCFVSKIAQQYLESREKPILLLQKKKTCLLSPNVAPGNAYLGFMLPYTPLHYFLLQKSNLVLIMTSANYSEEPIIIEDEKVFREFADKVDFLLIHDREIYNRCDDSVLKITPFPLQPIFIRRSRGYAPYPIMLAQKTKSVLALGAEEKNTVCFVRDNYAFPSQHLGDLKNKESFTAYQESIKHLSRVLKFEPEVIACDSHPDYLSTRYAEQLAEKYRLPLIKVQHHFAHIASCLAEHRISEQTIGIAFDGTGYGPDGAIWGGEFLIVSTEDYQRVGHLKYIAMPGGEQVIHEPWRMAFSYLYSIYGPELTAIPGLFRNKKSVKNLPLLKQMIDRGINSPMTSSCGRLFDAVASLIGLRDEVDFEGQAAIELESLCRESYKENYHYLIEKEDNNWVVNSREMFQQIITDLERNVPLSQIASQFHNTVADFILSLCVRIRQDYNINYVSLSGGVFQNSFLLERAFKKLKKEHFKVLVHKALPPNDACISLGQSLIADAQIKREGILSSLNECK